MTFGRVGDSVLGVGLVFCFFLLEPNRHSPGFAAASSSTATVTLEPFDPGADPVHVPIRLEISLAAKDAGELGQEAVLRQQAVVLVRADARVQVDVHERRELRVRLAHALAFQKRKHSLGSLLPLGASEEQPVRVVRLATGKRLFAVVEALPRYEAQEARREAVAQRKAPRRVEEIVVLDVPGFW